MKITIGGSQANLTYETCSGPLTCGTAFSFTVIAQGAANGFTSHPAFANASTNACTSTQCVFTQGYWKNHPAAWPVSTLNLGTTTYTKDQLLSILQTPVAGNGLIALALTASRSKPNAT